MEPSSSNHPRRLFSEDTVFYAIYPDPPSPPLPSLRFELLSSLSPFLQGYIWQHDPFHLSLPTPSPSCALCLSPSPPHLHGKSRFGDNLEDEWFLVSLLLHLSRSFPSLSLRVWDSDGDFLLIESAFALPRWLDPDNSPHRVFLRRGDLHILGRRSFPLGSVPSLADALEALRSGREPTRASDAVQAAIRRRIDGYPERAVSLMHRARVRLPLPVAQVLRHEPCLISLAVEGFYDRDVDSMKYASKMERFLRSPGGGVDLVVVSVRMSRAMYGQLVQQRFQAPRCYPMPGKEEGPGVFVEAELGMKISCGFEMMYQARKKMGEEGKGGAWAAFMESLESSGYFGDLLPGSEEYKRLMRRAEDSYKSSDLFSRTSDILNAPLRCIDEILASSYSVSDFESTVVPPSDDDSWLYGGEDELNAELAIRQKEMDSYELGRERSRGQQNMSNLDSGLPSDDNDYKEMANTLRAFVEKVSSFEGAEVPENRDLKEVDLNVDRFMECFKLIGKPSNGKHAEIDSDLEEKSSYSDMDFAYYFNPKYHYKNGLGTNGDLLSAVQIVVEKLVKDEKLQSMCMNEVKYYRDALGSFGRITAVNGRGNTLPDDGEDSDSDHQSDKDSPQHTFMNSYSNALNEELKATTLEKSFLHAHQDIASTSKGTSTDAEDISEGLATVNVDGNLVMSLLDSFVSQQGLPGPTSNLLGSLGLSIPRGKNEAEHEKQSEKL